MRSKESKRRSAIFDRTRKYRYSLIRAWDEELPGLLFIMLNPSTAGHIRNDRTIGKCVQFAQDWGYGMLEVVNLFAFRATSPDQLRKAPEPVGKLNDHYIDKAIERAHHIVIAWGNLGSWLERDRQVLKLLPTNKKISCLGKTKQGNPRHPLYLAKRTLLVEALLRE